MAKKNKLPTSYTINFIKYTVVSKIAEGGFSIIYKVKNEGNFYALKKIAVSDSFGVAAFRREASIMKKFGNTPYIVTYKDHACLTNENGLMEFFIVMELCKGSLLDDLKSKTLITKSKDYLQIFLQVSYALALLHYNDPPITHRDLKVENILKNNQNEYVLTDFGSCTNETIYPNKMKFADLENEIQNFTTVSYRSPEMINRIQGKLISTKSDIWALGCLFYKILYEKTPFDENQNKIINGTFTFPETTMIPIQFKDLINFMLVVDPDERPNIFEVISRICSLLRIKPTIAPPPTHAVIQRSIDDSTCLKCKDADEQIFCSTAFVSDASDFCKPNFNKSGQLGRSMYSKKPLSEDQGQFSFDLFENNNKRTSFYTQTNMINNVTGTRKNVTHSHSRFRSYGGQPFHNDKIKALNNDQKDPFALDVTKKDPFNMFFSNHNKSGIFDTHQTLSVAKNFDTCFSTNQQVDFTNINNNVSTNISTFSTQNNPFDVTKPVLPSLFNNANFDVNRNLNDFQNKSLDSANRKSYQNTSKPFMEKLPITKNIMNEDLSSLVSHKKNVSYTPLPFDVKEKNNCYQFSSFRSSGNQENNCGQNPFDRI